MTEQRVQRQHPIPQQVLGVEFKIVGDLTLRQFGILALFGGLAFIIFNYPGINPLIKVPLAAIIFLLGIALGLLPIQDQPLDRWLAYLISTIYSPTRRVWQKIPELPEFLVIPIPKLAKPVEEGISPEEARRRLEAYIARVKEEELLSPLDLAEKQRLGFINLELQATPPSEAKLPPPPPKPLPPRRRIEEVKKPSLAAATTYAVEPVFKLQRGEEVTYITTLRNIRVGRRFSTPAPEVVFAPAREKIIEPTLPSPPTLVAAAPSPPPLPFPPSPPPAKAKPTPTAPSPPVSRSEEVAPKEIKPPAPPTSGEAGRQTVPGEAQPSRPKKVKPKLPPKRPKPPPPLPPLGKKPNSILGTVSDEEGGIIEGALVVVKNKAGVTIRATKTNQLGQFVFSPFPNGSYTVELPKAKTPFAIIKQGEITEDAKQTRIIKVELTGTVVSPLEMKPKSS